jgi:hypothetical protein
MPKISFLFQTIIIVFGINSCEYSDNSFISKDPLVLRYFDLDDASELQTIHDFFISQISTAADKNSAEAIADLDAFLKNLKKLADTGILDLPIAYSDEKELINGLNTSLFDKIWDRDEEYGFIKIPVRSVYLAFLDELGTKHTIVQQYSDDIKSAGTIGAVATARLLMFPEKFDTKESTIRLLIAIHYITADYNNHISDEFYGGI